MVDQSPEHKFANLYEEMTSYEFGHAHERGSLRHTPNPHPINPQTREKIGRPDFL